MPSHDPVGVPTPSRQAPSLTGPDLYAVVDDMPAMVAYWNPDLTCRFANRAYRRWFGKDSVPVLGMSMTAMHGAARYERNRSFVEGALRGERQEFERSGVGPTGALRHSLVTFVPDMFEGQVFGFLAQVTDVTALKQSQMSLETVAGALQQAQRLGQIGSWEWDIASDTTRWSPELYRIAGLPPSSPAPSNLERARLYTSASFQRWEIEIARAIESKAPFALEVEITRPDGARRWIDARAEPVLDGSGAVMALRGTAQDITARRRAEDALRRSENFLTRTGSLAGVGGWEVDLISGEVFWSDQVCHIHGRPPGHRPTLEEGIAYYAPDSRPRIQQAVDIAMAGGPGFDLELQIVRHDGEPRWIRTLGSVEFEQGRPTRLAGAFQDITERHTLALELAAQHELMRVTLQSIGDAVITTDKDARVTWLNPVAQRMTGWTEAEASGRLLDQVFHIVHEETRQLAENPITACIRNERVTGLAPSTVLISRSGEEHGIQDSASPIRNDEGELLGAVLVFHDVTEQRRLSGEMSYRATHDALTGLVNRTEFEVRLERTLSESRLNGNANALMFIDLDQFKLVNDACGHAAGDQLLQQVARLLSGAVRSRDTLARLGGDEFAVLLERCTTEQAQRVAQQICERMDEFRFLHDGKRFRIGTSIGLVPVDARWAASSAIMQAADSSCYAAKEAGRNRVHAWFDTDAAMKARSGDMQWANRLEQALDDDRFVLFAQRIMPLAGSTDHVHAEVLIRMRDTDGTLIPPGAFLPAAERFHLAARIDKWVLSRAIRMLKALPSRDHIATLCINLSGQSVGDRSFHRKAFELLADAGSCICERLCIEITETATITNLADATRFIEEASQLGIRIALDDFGAGASSFGYLKSLRVDKLKIDGQFVRDVLTDPLDDAAVRCFVDVAHVIGVKTVAEFVDSAAVLDRVRELGVDYAQGFHLHKPEPLDAILRSTPPSFEESFPLPLEGVYGVGSSVDVMLGAGLDGRH